MRRIVQTRARTLLIPGRDRFRAASAVENPLLPKAARPPKYEQFGYLRAALYAAWSQSAADDLCEARCGPSGMARRGRASDIKTDKFSIGAQACAPSATLETAMSIVTRRKAITTIQRRVIIIRLIPITARRRMATRTTITDDDFGALSRAVCLTQVPVSVRRPAPFLCLIGLDPGSQSANVAPLC